MIKFIESEHAYATGVLYECTVMKDRQILETRYGSSRKRAHRRAMNYALTTQDILPDQEGIVVRTEHAEMPTKRTKMNIDDIALAMELVDKGVSITEIAKRLGYHPSTVGRYLDAAAEHGFDCIEGGRAYETSRSSNAMSYQHHIK